jgi:hypothetical protein
MLEKGMHGENEVDPKVWTALAHMKCDSFYFFKIAEKTPFFSISF